MKKIVYVVLLSTLFLGSCINDHTTALSYEVDATRSVVEWKGYLKNGDSNDGTITVKSESLLVRDGKIQSGTFSIPLSSIVNINLPADELKHQLVHHLQSVDFFDMALHPEMKFVITGIITYSGSQPDAVVGSQFLVSGDLTFLGKTNAISFPAKIDVGNDTLAVQGKVTIDRTLWGMNYASDETAPDGLYIKPGIDLNIKLYANKQ